MANPSWSKWLKEWRTIAEKSSFESYMAIEVEVDDVSYEVLRVSRFSG